MMYSAYKLNKQGDNIQVWCTPFPIWNQSVVPCSVLTVASWPAHRFLKGQVRWSGIPISWRIFQFVVIHTVKVLLRTDDINPHNTTLLPHHQLVREMSTRWSQTLQPPPSPGFSKCFVETFWGAQGFLGHEPLSPSWPCSKPFSALNSDVSALAQGLLSAVLGVGASMDEFCRNTVQSIALLKGLVPHQSARWVFFLGLCWDLCQES